MDRVMYLKHPPDIAKSSIEELFPYDDYMFMLGNDPTHTTKVVQRLMRREINTVALDAR